MAEKGRYTKFGNKIGLYSNSKGSFIKNDTDVVLSFPFKDTVLEAGMSKEDVGRDERFLHIELDSKDIDTLEEPKVLTDFQYVDKDGEKPLTASSDTEFFDSNGDLKQNLLVKGNNLLALYTLREKLAGKVKLIYIDPPYNTGSDGFRYNDSFNHSAWLAFMKNRLEVAKDLLTNDGTIFVQCDDNEQAYLKVLMDEIFKDGFLNTITLKAKSSAGASGGGEDKRLKKNTEYLLVYAKPGFESFKKIYEQEYLEDIITQKLRQNKQYEYKDVMVSEGTKRKFGTIQLGTGEIVDVYKHDNYDISSAKELAKKEEASLLGIYGKYYEKIFRTQDAQSSIRHKVKTLANGDKGLFSITYKPTSGRNRGKDTTVHYLKGEQVNHLTNTTRLVDGNIIKFTILGSLWKDIGWDGIANEGGVQLKFGKKPERLLSRIIDMTTKPNDIVLDFCLGSGTSVAVAHKMNRRWIGIEQMDYINTLAKVRLKNVVDGDVSGASKDVGWDGGGSYVYFELKKYNQEYIERITGATSLSELEDLYVDMRNNAFLKFWFDRKEFEKDENFRNLDIDKRKQKLVDVLDENQLYLNFDDMGDTRHNVTADEKALTDKFYGSAEN